MKVRLFIGRLFRTVFLKVGVTKILQCIAKMFHSLDIWEYREKTNYSYHKRGYGRLGSVRLG